MTMDIAVTLVETYLRLNGYLTLTEFEIQKRSEDGTWHTVTDVDMVGVRFPGPVYAADAHSDADTRFLLIEDEELRLEDECVDVIIGEVKQGEAIFNPGLTNHEALHTVLNRFAWLVPPRGEPGGPGTARRRPLARAQPCRRDGAHSPGGIWQELGC